MATVISITGVSASVSVGVITPIITPYNTFFDQMENDLNSVFFNTSEFSEVAIYTHKNGQNTTYKCLYDDPTTNISISSDELTLIKPQIMIREKIMINPPSKGDKVIIRGIRYVVDNYMSNGVGIMTLYLVKKATK